MITNRRFAKLPRDVWDFVRNYYDGICEGFAMWRQYGKDYACWQLQSQSDGIASFVRQQSSPFKGKPSSRVEGMERRVA
jgi:hypothetical protein